MKINLKIIKKSKKHIFDKKNLKKNFEKKTVKKVDGDRLLFFSFFKVLFNSYE